MSLFGNLTAGYIREGIDKKISEYLGMSSEEMKERNLTAEQCNAIAKGLRIAKEIAERYED